MNSASSLILLLLVIPSVGGTPPDSPSDPLTLAELMDPQLTSDEQIDHFARRCTHLLETTGQQVSQVSPTADRMLKRKLASTFLLFAKPGPMSPGVESGRLERVRLDTFADPALRLLRDRIGLRPPRGYVFVRYYRSKHLLPTELLAAFHREHTRAVTLGGRYIAMLSKPPADPGELSLQQRMERKILSHELVHAYLNASIDWVRTPLPIWFHEGCAVFLSNSPGGKRITELVDTPVGYRHVSMNNQAPLDYREYRTAFDYLRARLGKQDLFAAIKQVVESGDAQSLLLRMQVQSFAELLARAKQWKARRQTLGYSLAIVVLLALGGYVYRLLPKDSKHAVTPLE